MQIAKRRPRRKLFYLAIVAGIIVIGSGIAFAIYRLQPDNTGQSQSQESKINYDYNDPSSKAGRQEQIPAKQDPPSNQNPQNQPLSGVAITITQASQNSDTQQVIVRTIVEGTSSGTCRATFSKTGQPSLVKTAPVTVQASYAICEGFNVPKSEFPVGGRWELSITVEKDNETSPAAEKEIEVTL